MLLKITKINESKCIVTKFQMKCIISTAVHRFITVGQWGSGLRCFNLTLTVTKCRLIS